MSARWLVVALVATGCLHDDLVPCGTLLCARDAVCRAGRCVAQEALAACATAAQGSACTTSQITDGICAGGACIQPACGDGIVEAGEICDDGNTVDGDGCAADCSSIDGCPPIGTPPRFGVAIRQSIVQQCRAYTASTSADVAVAMCDVGLAAGPLAGPLEPVTGPPGRGYVVQGVLAPEGDELFTLEYIDPNVSNDAKVVAYTRVTDRMWTHEYDVTLPFAIDITTTIGVPAARPDRRMFVWPVGRLLHEIAIDATGRGTDLGTTNFDALGVGGVYMNAANLTPDGLRIVLASTAATGGSLDFYTDRPTLASPFNVAHLIDLDPEPSDPFMTSDCSRLYFAALQSIVYAPEL